MGRKKAGGGSTNYNIAGPLLSQSLYAENNIGDIKGIKEIYDDNLKKKGKELEIITNDLHDLNEIKNNEDLKTIKLKELENKRRIADDKNIRENVKIYGNIFTKLISGLWTNITSLFKTVGLTSFHSTKLAFTAGEGILFKVIIIVIVIIVIVFLILGFTGNLSSGNVSTDNDISKSILTYNNENNLSKPSGSFFGIISNKIYNSIPNDSKYKFNALQNSLNYVATGKYQYDDYLEPRNEITVGRCDDIFHINFNINTDSTYSLLEPKPIEIIFPENSYNTDIDYYKINSELRKNINYPTKVIIPFKTETNNNGGYKYVLDVNNQQYFKEDKDDYINITHKINSKNFIFKKNKNNIILNSFSNNNFNNVGDYIALYGIKLLNKNYKGPIMTIIHNNNNINIYYDISTDNKYLYYYFDSNNTKQDLGMDIRNINTNNYYKQITRLYDQTGNGYDYIFNNTKKSANLQLLNTNVYAIRFEPNSILYLSKKYPNVKSTIKALLENNDYKKINSEINTRKYYKDLKVMYLLKIIYTISDKNYINLGIKFYTQDNNNKIINFETYHRNLNKDGSDINTFKITYDVNKYYYDKEVTINYNFDLSNPSIDDVQIGGVIDDSNKFEGNLRKMEIILEDDYKCIFGPKNYISTDLNDYTMVLVIIKDEKTIMLHSKKDDDNLYEYNNENKLYSIFNTRESEDITLIIGQNINKYELAFYFSNNKYPKLIKYNSKYVINFSDNYQQYLIDNNTNKIIKTKRIKEINIIIIIESIIKCKINKKEDSDDYICSELKDEEQINKDSISKDYIDLLSSKSSSIIKLKFDIKDKKYKVENALSTSIINPTLYDYTKYENIEIDIDDPSLIEYLGAVNDGNILEHGFTGNLIELKISKIN